MLRLVRERRLGSRLSPLVQGHLERLGLLRGLGKELPLVDDRAVGAVLDRVHRDPGPAPEPLVVAEPEAALAHHVAHLEGTRRLLDLLCCRLGHPAENRRGPGSGRPQHLHGRHPQRTLDRVDAVDVVGQCRIGDAQRDGVDEGSRARRNDPLGEGRAVDADDRGELPGRTCRRLARDLRLVDADGGQPPLGHELAPGPVDDVRPLGPLLREVERLVGGEIRSHERGAPPDLPDVVDATQAHLGVVGSSPRPSRGRPRSSGASRSPRCPVRRS